MGEKFDSTKKLENFEKSKDVYRIHFVGVGGIGMSAQAMHEHFNGKSVSGSDPYSSERTVYLKHLGIKVYDKHEESNVEGMDEIVVTPAISKENPEYLHAVENNIKITMRIDHFRRILEPYKGFAVTGTDGKSTTTSMLANSLMNLGADPYVFLGALHQKLEHGNYRKGKEIAVYELDESQPGFELFKPEYLIITNIREDHLENYKNLEHYYASFETLIKNSKFVVTFADEKKFSGNVSYGVYSGDFKMVERKQDGFGQIITLLTPWGEKKLFLPVPGYHNALNALAVVSLLSSIGYNIDDVLSSFRDFSLPGRRFNVSYDDKSRNLTLVDDYAHTADELEVILKTAKEIYPDRKIVVVFQPHRYTRLKREAERFRDVLKDADEIYITEVYGAFESKNGVSARKIVEGIPKAVFVEKLEQLKEIRFDSNSVYMFVGAGDIYEISQTIRKELAKG
ncbi:UDP-N-acetylmuramate--L-alanine ligase [Fervidobacterium gondwanense]|uniref:UDP-N-acetylmuramate--L-alanine ligase n=1 Tax=Fervidobacterium gondwanense DSM 13020 TaxID=1121883 RepID=A0A1M7SUM0_FERGO|nr:UDP-N-acetylmuramate--L-alanine ligase [Fervidobacterium gondwanense]SHN62243.1 UDP-N-acetylmuramate--L-alanine ligase [Fervidobacterium gondwanense DSM 13020]